MAEMFSCACGFKSVEGQLAKTAGACPKCGKRTAYNKEKYGGNVEQTELHKAGVQ